MAEDLDARILNAVADRYAIERELGAGGMAFVYLAKDLKHGRQVAVKVLRPEVAAALGADRFLREIEIAAQLNHPHLLPLYDSGQADSFLFYVMPFVKGDSLRDRLNRERQLPIDDAIRIAREVADGLSYAHDQGVVHRDIKPENILLSAEHAVIADFGIARAMFAAGGDKLTETGIAIGTPDYMSPEQAAGESEIDARSDVYSLGCVTYEMLVGGPPFTGPNPQSILSRRLTEAPPSLRKARETISDELEATVLKSLAKLPADRTQSARLFADTLDRLKSEAPIPPAGYKVNQNRRLRVFGLSAAFMLLLVVVLLTRIPLGTDRGTDRSARPRVAVLPFDNLGTVEYEFFAEGITEEITSRLAQISGLRVVSRTSALRYKDHDAAIVDIGAALNVEYVLEGTVRTDRVPGGTGRVRVTPQLIRVSDDVHLWTDRYDAAIVPGEIFGVQAEIAEQVAQALDVTLLEREKHAIGVVATTDPEAYEAYLLGRFHWRKRDPASLRLAASHFEDAISRDSSYASAYAGLADAYAVAEFHAASSDREAFVRAGAAARRAIELDSTLAEGHASLGATLFWGYWDWAGSEREFKRAIDLDPDYAVARVWYAEYLGSAGRTEEALIQLELAVALDPLSAVAHNVYGWGLAASGRLEEATNEALRAAELQPSWDAPFEILMLLYSMQENGDGLHRVLERLGYVTGEDATFAHAMIGQLNPATVNHLAEQFERDRPDPLGVALVYAPAEMVDSAFANLEEAVELKDARLPMMLAFPLAHYLGNDPRYDVVRRSMGLISN